MKRELQLTWRRKRAIVLVAALTAITGLVGCGDDEDESTATTTTSAGPAARASAVGKWKLWVLSAPDQIEVPAPPAEGSTEREAELAEVRKVAGERTAAVEAQAKKWSGAIPTEPWTVINNEYIASQAKDPPLSSRNLAYTHAAMYDALVAAYHWKDVYKRAAPEGVDALLDADDVPSYPSEHAAMAGAASRVLTHLYPNKPGPRLEELAEEAADSRVAAGTNTRSDVEAGLALGRSIADEVIAKADADGSDVKWDGKRPTGVGGGPRFWEPPPGSVSPPIQPLAGAWKTWVLASGDQLRSSIPAPPAYDSAEFKASAQKLIDIKRDLTDDQKRIAKFWEGAEGTPLPAGIVNQVILEDVRGRKLSAPEATRVFALVNIAMADAGGAVWDAKFAYWYPRPENAIRDSGIDRSWSPHLPTPRFPAYPSGSAGYAGAAEGVMTALFPADAVKNKARAEEQAISRQYAGIHWDFDAVSLEMGREVAKMVIERQGLKTRG